MKMNKKTLASYLISSVLFAVFSAAQSTVTTTGGTANSVPKFNGTSTVVNSAITEDNGNVTIGPFERIINGTGFSGFVSTTGNLAALAFTRRSLTAWPGAPTAGDEFAWYNPDGTARLSTYGTGDMFIMGSGGNATFGPFAIPSSSSGYSVLTGPGSVSTTGPIAGYYFARRNLSSWPPATPTLGDLFAWYNPDGGGAHLWAFGGGDVLTIKNNGELDLAGALRFPDGSVQSSAAASGGGITNILAGSGIMGGGSGPTVNISVDSTVARLNADNQTFIGNQTINGNLRVTGTITSSQTSTEILAGSCNTNSVNVTNFVLKGLGQDSSDSCSVQLGTITQDNPAGTLVTHTGTLSNLIARQANFNSGGVGGSVIVWINHFTTTGVLSQTSIQCNLGSYSQNANADCFNTSSTASISAGDKIVVEVVLPSGANTLSPVAAEVTLTF